MIPALLAATCVLLLAVKVDWASPARTPVTTTPGEAGATTVRDGVRARRSRRGPRSAAGDPGEVAAWCDRLARAVRSGSSLTAAIRSEEPPAVGAAVVAEIVLALDRGVPLSGALGVTAPSPHLRLALTVVRACAAHGGPAGEPLDRAAAVLRARDADLAEQRTQSAQARLSAVVMTVLPIAVLTVLVATSGPVRAELVTPLGFGVVLTGAALNLAGWHWMRRLIDGVAR